jgi:peptidyl-prolyl cis-trans isomerase C
MFESLTKDVKVDEAKAKAFYDENNAFFEVPEQIRASHILIKTDDATNDVLKAAARAKIEGILKQVKDGGDFAALAAANSDCPSKSNGGDLGLFGKGQMVPPFEEAAFALSTNEVSGVVETSFGYHIIKLTDRVPASKRAFDEVKEQIVSRLTSEEQGKIVSEYVEKISADLKYKANDKLKLFVKDEIAPEADAVEPAADAK